MANKLRYVFLLAVIFQIFLFIKLDHFIWDVGLVVSTFTAKGLTPYVDFSVGQYFPIPKILIYILLVVFNWRPEVTIYIGLAQLLITQYLLYKLSDKYLNGIFKLLPLIFFTLWSNFILGQFTFDTNLFVGTLLLILFIIYLKITEKVTIKLFILFGIVSGLAFFSQQMTLIAIAIMALSLLISFRVQRKQQIKKLLLYGSLGFVSVAIPVFAIFITRGVFNEFIAETVAYYLDPTRYPFSKLGFSVSDIRILSLVSWPLIVLLISLKNIKGKSRSQAITLAIVCIATISSFFIAVIHPRRYLYILPLLSFALGYSMQHIRIKKLHLVAIILITIISLFSLQKTYQVYLSKNKTYAIYNEPHQGDGDFEAINWLRHNSPEDAKIQVMGPMLWYWATDRLPANRFTYSGLPWTYEPFEDTKNIWQDSPADYWLVDENLFRRYREWGYPKTAEFIRELLTDKYKVVAKFNTTSVYKLQK